MFSENIETIQYSYFFLSGKIFSPFVDFLFDTKYNSNVEYFPENNVSKSMIALIFKCCWVFGANFSWDIHHIFLQPSLIFHQVFSENIGFLLNYWIFCEDKISRTQQPYCKIGILYLNLNHATKGCDSNLFGGNFPFVTFEICPGYFVLVKMRPW